MVQRHLAKELHQASNRLRRRIDRISLAHGLTGPQGMVLAFLSWHSQPVVQRDVEQEFDVRRSTVSCLLTQLEKDGFIRRESVEGDARLRRLVVTQKGLEAHRAVNAEVVRYEQQVLDTLTPEEQETFFRLLGRLSDAAAELQEEL